ncbi:MAG: hypothetical protein HYX67_01310, partial [Candidatus Melainabacteria bacterium]|nr:hypothetical protein [Candidatus Melainabacteria bacterium]
MRKLKLVSVILVGSMTLLRACSPPEEKNVSATTGDATVVGAKSSGAAVKSAPLVSPLHQTYL